MRKRSALLNHVVRNRISLHGVFGVGLAAASRLRDCRSITDTPMTNKTLLALALMGALGCASTTLASASIISINPSKDNTLYEYDATEGDLSNALGSHFFAGETALSKLRRGVLAFDVAGSIPAGSTITAVSLSMNVSRVPFDTYTVELHKLLADWGEGTSQASGEEGTGAPATPNDATRRHRFFDTIFWTTQGGDFSATVSASQQVGGVGTVHVELCTNDCGCARMVGQPGQQLRLIGPGR
jgi:hypothetical protein